MLPSVEEDLSWLDDSVRRGAAEMLRLLFSSGRVSVITFNAGGVIVGVNAQTAALGGGQLAHYRGVNLLTHPILRRLGWAKQVARVLAKETIEFTDSRWVTLFSSEEKYIDIVAGPIIVEGWVVGGVAYLIDATANHRALVAESAGRQRARELELFMARDVARLVTSLTEWAKQEAPRVGETARAMVAVLDLASLLDDLLQFVQLETYQPVIERVLLLDAASAAGVNARPRAPEPEEASRIAVLADPRLLRRVVRNLVQFNARIGGGGWSIDSRDGRVLIQMQVEGSHQLLQELLTANPLSAAESDGAGASLAAARWMTEMMNGTLTASETEPSLYLNLPAAESQVSNGASNGANGVADRRGGDK